VEKKKKKKKEGNVSSARANAQLPTFFCFVFPFP